MKPMTIIFIGAIIAIIGGIITALGTYLHNKKSSEKSDRIEKGVVTGISLSQITNNEISNLKHQNSDLKNELSKNGLVIDNLRQENTKLYEQLKNNITGGDSFAVISIKPVDEKSAVIFVENHGNFPIYDLHFVLIDFNGLVNSLENQEKNILNKHFYPFELGTLTAKSNQLFTKIYGDFSKNEINITINISSRSYIHTEILKIRKNETNWINEVNLFDPKTRETLFKKTI